MQFAAPLLSDKETLGDVTNVFVAVDFFGRDTDMDSVAMAGADAQVRHQSFRSSVAYRACGLKHTLGNIHTLTFTCARATDSNYTRDSRTLS
jgi:hypothetical protein